MQMTEAEKALYDFVAAVVDERIALMFRADIKDLRAEVVRQLVRMRQISGDDWQ